MKLYTLLFTLLFNFSIPISWALDFDTLKKEVGLCLEGQKKNTEFCKKIDAHLNKMKFKQDHKNVFSEAEWNLRLELKEKGLILPNGIIALAYQSFSFDQGEVIVVFDWAYTTFDPKNPEPRDQSQIDWIIKDANLFDPNVWDGGTYNNIEIFQKKKGEQSFQLTYAESIYGECQESSLSWFGPSTHVFCPKTLSLSTKKNFCVCFTNFWSKQWPEVHVFDDARASTGIVLRSIITSPLGNAKKVLEHGGKYEQVQTPKGLEWIFNHPTTSERISETWLSSSRGKISIWNANTSSLEVSEKLTNQYYPYETQKLSQKALKGEPNSAGFYTKNSNRKLYKFIQ